MNAAGITIRSGQPESGRRPGRPNRLRAVGGNERPGAWLRWFIGPRSRHSPIGPPGCGVKPHFPSRQKTCPLGLDRRLREAYSCARTRKDSGMGRQGGVIERGNGVTRSLTRIARLWFLPPPSYLIAFCDRQASISPSKAAHSCNTRLPGGAELRRNFNGH